MNFGSGLLKFLGSTLSGYLSSAKFFKIDLDGCLTRVQVEEKILADTKLSASALVLHINTLRTQRFCIIFERISPKIDGETLNYLVRFATEFRLINKDIYFVFSSATMISQLSNYSIKLDNLTQPEITTVLTDRYGAGKFSKDDSIIVFELSEGIVSKLDHLMSFLDNCSADELSTIDDIFDDVYYEENLSITTRESIQLLSENPNKNDTYLLLKILAVLKNGESIKTIRDTKLGASLTPRNTKELTSLELATSTTIDSATTIIKLNSIVKDYVVKMISPQEVYDISREFLAKTIVVGKDKINLSSINRKTNDYGLRTEEDNAVTLLRNNISFTKSSLRLELLGDEDKKALSTQLYRLLYLSKSYVMGLLGSSRFSEAAIASHVLLNEFSDVEDNSEHQFYSYLAFSQRMLGNYDVAFEYLKMAKAKCPKDDKVTSREITIDELYLLDKRDPAEAVALAKRVKTANKANTDVYIIADIILANSLNTKDKIEKLKSNEKKARRLQYPTTANNILLSLNRYMKDSEKLSAINTVLKSEKSAYNTCRATIIKYEIFLEKGNFEKINDDSINELKEIYNYLYYQGLENLFNRCHDILWRIAMQKEIDDLIENIFFQGILIWRLKNDSKSEEKYKKMYNESFEGRFTEVFKEE